MRMRRRTHFSCQNIHSCRRGYGRNFLNMVMRSSARFPALASLASTGVVVVSAILLACLLAVWEGVREGRRGFVDKGRLQTRHDAQRFKAVPDTPYRAAFLAPQQARR